MIFRGSIFFLKYLNTIFTSPRCSLITFLYITGYNHTIKMIISFKTLMERNGVNRDGHCISNNWGYWLLVVDLLVFCFIQG